MTLTDEIKILDNKIKLNQDQYDLDREAAKNSALSSKELDKFEYLTGEGLGYKQRVVKRAKFEYSLLGKALNKVLKEDYKDSKVVKYNNDLCITLINIVCLILMKYHQLTLNLMH